MLAYHELLYLKEIHSDYDLLYVNFDGADFVFRCLTKEEYKEIISIIVDDFEFEDAVCQCCLIYPEDYNFNETYIPGLSSKITPRIIEISNLNDPKKLIEIYEDEKLILNNFDEQCITLIKAAFPEYSYEQINTWPWKKIMKYSARAEKVMKFRGYDIGLINNYDDYQEKVEQATSEIDERQIGNALRDRGIDPMDYFSYEFNEYKDSIDYPIIGTLNWQDDNILEAIRKQMENKYEARTFEKIEFIK